MRSISKRLVTHYVALSFLVLIILEATFLAFAGVYYIGSVEQILVNKATTSAVFYNQYAPKGGIEQKARFVFESIDENEPALVELIDTKGRVVIDNSGTNESYIVDGNDYKKALQGKQGVWKGWNDSGELIIAVSMPITEGNKIVGVLRYVSSLEEAVAIVARYTFFAIVIGIFVIFGAFVVSGLMAQRIVRPIKELIRVTEEITQGNFKVQAVKYDDDEIGQLAEAINVMAGEINRTDKIKSDFISSVSHELRTPLTSIKGWGETILLGDEDDQEEAKEGLSIICRETDRLIMLVEGLLDFSQIQGNTIQLVKEEFSPEVFLRDIRSQFSAKAKQYNVKLLMEKGNEKVNMYADYNRLKQVMINLVENSLKFTQGRPNGWVKLAYQEIDNNIVMVVEDNGSGIAEEHLAKVKDKFYKGNSNKWGSGLGLSIANEIVRLHEGKMIIDSIQGEGTKIFVIIPKGLDKG